MSSDIYATADVSKKVRNAMKTQEVEWEEREMEIYESVDAIGDDRADVHTHEGGPPTEKRPPAAQRRPFRAAAFGLGVLCFLMTTGIILLSIYFTLEKEQLQTRYNQLSNSCSRLQGDVSDNRSQLQSRYETLSKNHIKLQDEVKQLKGELEGKRCPEGWMRFGCSCYFKSEERKEWDASRSDCQQRRADLVVINNKEEDNFIRLNKMHKESWIGLRAVRETSKQARWEWERVDGSPLPQMFWSTGSRHRPAASCCDQQGGWTQSRAAESKSWICEKHIS